MESLSLARETGPYYIVADNLDELADLAALEDRVELAARLLGAAHALRQAKQMRPLGIGQRRHACVVTEVPAALGDAAGQTLGRAEAIALALDTRLSAIPATDGESGRVQDTTGAGD